MGLLSFLNPLAAPAFPTLQTTYKVGYLSAYHSPKKLVLPSPVLTATNEPVLKVEEVGWALFYPADVKDDKIKGDGVDWLVRPISALIEGYSRFLGVSKHLLTPVFHLVGSSATIPQLHASAPLLPAPTPSRTWPLLVFSHGLGGGKHVYSQLCRALAGSGYVVLALDHKDGTGPTTAIHEIKDGKLVVRQLPYIKNEELTWTASRGVASKEPFLDDKIPLRQGQLEIRHHEVYEAFRAFSKLVSGEAVEGFTLDEVKPSKSTVPGRLGEDWIGAVNVDQIAFGGHSFGGATTLHVLSNPPPSGMSKIPITKALLLDPWLDPLPRADDPKLRKDLPPVFCVNSEGFTVWKDHFTRLSDILSHWGASPAWFMSILQISHHTFSDFPLLTPTLPSLPFSRPSSSFSAPSSGTSTPTAAAKSTPATQIATIVALSQAFLHTPTPTGASLPALAAKLGVLELEGGEMDGGRVEIVVEGPDKKGKMKRRIKGEAGEVRVHFRPA